MNVNLSASKCMPLDYQNGYNATIHVFNGYRVIPDFDTVSYIMRKSYTDLKELKRGYRDALIALGFVN